MRKVLLGIFLLLSLSVPAEAMEITAPEVPKTVQERMPQNTDSFGKALSKLIENSICLLQPAWTEAVRVSIGILSIVLLVSVLSVFTEKLDWMLSVPAAVILASMMFRNTSMMIEYASDTVIEICEYGKLLCPVLTTAMAAQGGITTSAALYAGTMAFITFLCVLVSRLIVPMVNIFLALSVVYSALKENTIKRMADALKNILTWLLKTLLIGFTTYMSVTGVVSGTTDAAALKAAKVTISSVVPVVGGILSDASESVLVGMAVMKNSAGIYGVLAVLAIVIGPFVKVGMQYLLLKGTVVLCEIFGNKNVSSLVNAFSTAMGLLLAMLATGCLMVLISTVCFLKGIG